MTDARPVPACPAQQLWLVWDCTHLTGSYPDAAHAEAARAELLDRLDGDFGPDPLWADTVTTQRVWTTAPHWGAQ